MADLKFGMIAEIKFSLGTMDWEAVFRRQKESLKLDCQPRTNLFGFPPILGDVHRSEGTSSLYRPGPFEFDGGLFGFRAGSESACGVSFPVPMERYMVPSRLSPSTSGLSLSTLTRLISCRRSTSNNIRGRARSAVSADGLPDGLTTFSMEEDAGPENLRGVVGPAAEKSHPSRVLRCRKGLNGRMESLYHRPRIIWERTWPTYRRSI